ncbi:MAG: OmpA family protein [Candidatus Omnitrophota bacterium]|jgi:peptidoglycan-associated lipoprotein|nr:MAG: OmpA family protein [Candidatus Omnitrophota bacterium]
MNKNYYGLSRGILVFAALALLAGCASSPGKITGGYALASKGIPDTGGDADDKGGSGLSQRPFVPEGQIPIDKLPGAEGAQLCQRILFDYDKFEIKSEWQSCLNNIAVFLNANTKYMLVIEGHCDERGSNEYNLALGEKRARTAADYLIKRGLSAERIVTRSWGEERPLALGHDEASWRQNRRAEFFGVAQ